MHDILLCFKFITVLSASTILVIHFAPTQWPVFFQLDILLECASKNEEVLAKAQSAIAIVKAKNKELVKVSFRVELC